MSEINEKVDFSGDLESIDVSNPLMFQQDAFRTVFKRLRDEAPVHYCRESAFDLRPKFCYPSHRFVAR